MGRPRQKTFMFAFWKVKFKISDDGKSLVITKKHKNGTEIRQLGMISKNQARRLADWLEWWTK